MEIKKYLKGRIVFLGMGNSMRGDDGVGCNFIQMLKKSKKAISSRIDFFDGGLMPENYLEPIVKINPDRVFIVEAVDFEGFPGEAKLFKEAQSQLNFSTHTLSLTFILDYLKEKTKANVFILGIQPRQLQWGAALSSEVKATVQKLITQLITA